MSDGKTRRYMNEREWQCFEDGVKYERERVIKLLEGYFKPEEAKAIYPADYEQYLDIIALIKGEK